MAKKPSLTEVPVDELLPITVELIPMLRFVDEHGNLFKLEPGYQDHGTFSLTPVYPKPEEDEDDEPGRDSV